MARFDDEGHLLRWRDKGAYPAIHDGIFDMVLGARATTFLDLCCSTGLLGTRIIRKLGCYAVGLEADPDARALAEAYGIPLDIVGMKLEPTSLNQLRALLKDRGVRAVVARRCLPEILDPCPEAAPALAATLADSGVAEVYLEGRVLTSNAVSRFPCVEQEVAALASHYHPVARAGRYAVLRRGRALP